MKRKLEILCYVLAVVAGFSMYMDISYSGKAEKIYFQRGRIAAGEHLQDADKGMNSFPVYLEVKDASVCADSIYNSQTGRYEQLFIEEGVIISESLHSSEEKTMWFVSAFAVLFYVAIICFWIVFISTIKVVEKEQYFDGKLEKRFTLMGWSLITSYAIKFACELIGAIWSSKHIELENYNVIFKPPVSYLICFGVGLLILAQIFKMARAYKEENDLTI
ncbi:MAG: DUF2975 domain-containing protein [Bacteroidales bacterium]|nr:DUF2975 domain-containing protein [Bacteroidales bacterium]MBQ8811403.1 DUF2975 domain-containing protein [Bacteroidales bacterium]